MLQYEKVIEALHNIDNGDEVIDQLEDAMKNYCGMYDMCEGYKHAIEMTIRDQYENHSEDQDGMDLLELYQRLTK